MLRSRRPGTTPGVSGVLTAVYMGRGEIRDFLIASGAVLELPEAAAVGNLARVRELIENNHAKADSFSPDGFAVVALAAFLGHLEIVQYLAAHGADVNAAATNGSGYNALTAAVTSGHLAVVQWLLEHGANANYRYSAGYSPLLTAACQRAPGYRQTSPGPRRRSSRHHQRREIPSVACQRTQPSGSRRVVSSPGGILLNNLSALSRVDTAAPERQYFHPMIGLLRGRLLEKRPNQVILDVGGVGYLVAVPLSTFAALADLHAEVTLLIHTHVREDALGPLRFSLRARKTFFRTAPRRFRRRDRRWR